MCKSRHHSLVIEHSVWVYANGSKINTIKVKSTLTLDLTILIIQLYFPTFYIMIMYTTLIQDNTRSRTMYSSVSVNGIMAVTDCASVTAPLGSRKWSRALSRQ